MVSLCVYTLDYGLAGRGCSKRKVFQSVAGIQQNKIV